MIRAHTHAICIVRCDAHMAMHMAPTAPCGLSAPRAPQLPPLPFPGLRAQRPFQPWACACRLQLLAARVVSSKLLHGTSVRKSIALPRLLDESPDVQGSSPGKWGCCFAPDLKKSEVEKRRTARRKKRRWSPSRCFTGAPKQRCYVASLSRSDQFGLRLSTAALPGGGGGANSAQPAVS